MRHVETMGHRVDSDLYILASSHHHTKPICFADISGHSSILKTSPLFKFFEQLRGRKKDFLSLLYFLVVLKKIYMPKRYFGVADSSPLYTDMQMTPPLWQKAKN